MRTSIHFYFICSLCSCEIIISRITQMTEFKHVQLADHLGVVSTSSVLQCAIECANNLACNAMSYHTIQGRCRLYSSSFDYHPLGCIDEDEWNSFNLIRGWDEYRDGFGDVDHEFWLGNEQLHALLFGGENELRVDMEDFESNTAYAKYNYFDIGDAANKYRLDISGFLGNTGDSMKRQNGHPFTTKDENNGNNGNPVNCAVRYHGAWWYEDCHDSNLNGLYLSGITSKYANGIVWLSWKGYYYSLKSTKMMFRRLATA